MDEDKKNDRWLLVLMFLLIVFAFVFFTSLFGFSCQCKVPVTIQFTPVGG